MHLLGDPEILRSLCKHMPAVLIILGPKSPPQPPLLIEGDMHHLHGHQEQEIAEEWSAVERERFSKYHAESAPVHGIPCVAIQGMDYQMPAQQQNDGGGCWASLNKASQLLSLLQAVIGMI